MLVHLLWWCYLSFNVYPISGLLCFINCWSVRLATSVQNIFAFTKLIAIFAIIAGGIYSLVIGKKGAVIRKLQQDFEANLTIDRETNIVHIVAPDKEKVTGASNAVTEIVQTWTRENAVIGIPREAISTIIGKQGSSIKKIRSESGIENIDVDREKNCLRIRGKPETIQVARTLIAQIIEKFERENDAVTIGQDETALPFDLALQREHQRVRIDNAG